MDNFYFKEKSLKMPSKYENWQMVVCVYAEKNLESLGLELLELQ